MKIAADIRVFRNASWSGRFTILLCLTVITISLVSFYYNGIARSFNNEEPDPYYFYTVGRLWLEGANIYDYDLIVSRLVEIGSPRASNNVTVNLYPPLAGMYFSLFSHSSVSGAVLGMVVVNLVFTVVSLYLLAAIISWYRPIGLYEFTLLVVFLNTGYGRTTIRMAHLSAVLFVCLLATFILARHKRPIAAGIVFGLVSIKPTFLPLYGVYYLAQRSFRLIASAMIIAALLTVLPLILTQRSIVESITGWIQMFTRQDTAGYVSDPGPFEIWSSVMLHLQPLIYRIWNGQTAAATILSWGIIVSLCGYAFYLILRGEPSKRGYLLDFALVSALSMISLYHRIYDVFLMLPGLVYIYIHASDIHNSYIQRRWLILLGAMLLLYSMPNDLVVRITWRFPFLEDSYLWRVFAPFQAWSNVAVVAVLLWLKRRQVLEGKRQAVATAVEAATA